MKNIIIVGSYEFVVGDVYENFKTLKTGALVEYKDNHFVLKNGKDKFKVYSIREIKKVGRITIKRSPYVHNEWYKLISEDCTMVGQYDELMFQFVVCGNYFDVREFDSIELMEVARS